MATSQECSYTFVKVSLIVINVIYVLVAMTMIGAAIFAGAAQKLTSLPILGAVTAMGILLLLLSVMGFVGAAKHNQICLFFYMVLICLMFMIQFSTSIAALALDNSQQKSILESGWMASSKTTKNQIEKMFNCCGFDAKNLTVFYESHPECSKQLPCYYYLQDSISRALKIAGGVGLAFSFTLFVGVYLSHRFRNMKDNTDLDDNFF